MFLGESVGQEWSLGVSLIVCGTILFNSDAVGNDNSSDSIEIREKKVD